MSLDTSLGNAIKKIEDEKSRRFSRMDIRMASIQIMMILAFILMTMMMKYLPL